MNRILPEHQPYTVPINDKFGGGIIYRIQEKWVWEWRGILIVAEKGMLFDGASIPWLVRAITGYSPDGMHRAAAVAHDIGCARKGVLVHGAYLGFPEHQAVLWGSKPDAEGRVEYVEPVPRDMIVGQLDRGQVHQMWGEFLRATDGSRPIKNWILHTGVVIGGPSWKLKYPAWKTP